MDLTANFAESNVSAAPSPATTGTDLKVITGEGARFPTPPFQAVIGPASGKLSIGNIEIVTVNGLSGDHLSIARAQESTSARTVIAGDRIFQTITKKFYDDVNSSIAALSNALSDALSAGAATANSLSDALSAAVSALTNASTAASLAEASNRISADNALSVRVDTVSNSLSAAISALKNASTTGSLVAISLAVSADTALSVRIDTVSNQVSVNLSALVNASTAGSLAALSLMSIADAGLSVRIDTQSNLISKNLSAVMGASTAASLAALSLAISADAALSVRIDTVSNALSNEISNRLSLDTALSLRIDTVSNQVSVNLSAVNNASTVGSLAALSLMSVQFGNGQFRNVGNAQTLSTGTFTKVSGLSLSIGQANFYEVHGQVNFNLCAGSTTAVFQLGMSATNQPVYAAFMFIGNQQAQGATGSVGTSAVIQFGGESAISATPSIMFSMKPQASGVGYMVTFTGTIQGNAGAAAVLKVVAATSTTASGGGQIRPGSYIRAYRIG